jgi:uncharacterized membrane protein
MAVNNPVWVMAILFALSAIGFLSEKTRLGRSLTSTVVVILLAIVAANIGLIPHESIAYNFVFSYVVPIIIPLFLFKANLRQMATEASRLSGAFLLATVATVIGVLVAITLVDVSQLVVGNRSAQETEAAIAGLFASTYIGGSVNYAALGEVTGLIREASFFSAATAVDNLYSALYLSVLAILPAWRWLAQRFAPDSSEVIVDLAPDSKPTVTAQSLTYSLALALVIVACSDALVAWLDWSMYRYAIITLVTVTIATTFPALAAKLEGSFELGVALSMVFFAAIAAGANVQAVITLAPILIVFTGVLLLVHGVSLLLLGRLFKLSLPELIVASNAAILGATTAPALAAAKGWQHLIIPGVLVGVLGYALGTLVGTALYQWLL